MPLGLNRQDSGKRKQTGEEEFCQETSGLIYETLQSSAPPAANVYWCFTLLTECLLNEMHSCTALFADLGYADMHGLTLLNWGGYENINNPTMIKGIIIVIFNACAN